MDGAQILRTLDDERQNLARDGEVLERLPHITRLRPHDRSYRVVIHSTLSSENADAAIATEIAHHRKLGVGFEWKLYSHDRPPDLLGRLRGHGFSIGSQEALLVLDLARPPDWVKDENVVVRRVGRIEQVSVYRRVAEEALDKNYELTARQLADAIRSGSNQHRAYIAYTDDEEPASIGRLYTHPHSAFGGLFGGATLPRHRHRGFYRATVAARARDAIELGAKYLLVDALPTSQPILERLGFVHVADTWPCEWRP